MPDPAVPAHPVRIRWAAPLGLTAALVAVAAGLLLSGAAGAAELVDPGPLVRWGLPAVTTLTYAATMTTIGAYGLLAVALPGEERTSGARRLALRVGTGAAVAWTLLQLAGLLLTHASITGSVGGPDYTAQLAQFLTEIELGYTLLWALVLAALTAVVGAGATGATGAAWATVLGVAATLPVAMTGHAAGATSHEVAVSSMWMHTAGISLWIGGLAVLVVLGPRLGPALPDTAERFSRLAAWCYALVAVSGLANASIRLNSPTELLTTDWGRLLAVKVLLFALLGWMGQRHRAATIPALRADAHRGSTGRGRTFWRLAAAEVATMGAVTGVAVALGASVPPVPEDPLPDPSPVFTLTGYPAPPEPTVAAFLTQWRPDPLLLLVTVAGAFVYVRWVLRLRRRGDTWPVGRTVSWLVGMALLAYVTTGGPAVYGRVLFSAHMVQHMSLVMLLPILYVVGAPVTLAVRALPHRADGSRGPREWLLALVHSRWARAFAHPIVAAVNFAGSMVVFYYTDLFEGALTTHVGHLLMVLHFSLAGYLFVNVLIGVDPGPKRPGYPLRLMLLLATMAFHAFFGISIMESTALLAADHFGWLGLPWGVDALADQNLGGQITWGIGELPTLVLAVVVAVRWAQEDERTARREDRRAVRDHDADLAAYNAMLAGLAERDRDEEG